MSPPCLASIFEGDNGGATARGVSSTEIRVGVPAPSTSSARMLTIEAMFAYANQHFELYGRRMVPVFVNGSTASATGARAVAADVDAQDVFAATTAFQDWGFPQAGLVNALARSGIVTISQNLASWWSDRATFDALHPYVWSVYPSSEDMQTNLADFACRSLAGRPARHAGATTLRSVPRRFGIVAAGQEIPPAATLLTQALDACSSTQPPMRLDWASTSGDAALQTGLAKLRASGVTTLICVCEGLYGLNSVVPAAQSAAFFPEWILNASPWAGNNDDEYGVQARRNGSALPPPMRLSAGPRMIPLQARPWFSALRSTGFALPTDSGAAYDVYGIAGLIYDQLLVLASGIQGAGPMLTPETFAAALMATQYPNPGAGAAPYWQPSAGFGPGDHSFYDDYNVAWWSDTADALNQPASPNPKGSWCYLGAGSRYRPGTYPADADGQLFDPAGPCR